MKASTFCVTILHSPVLTEMSSLHRTAVREALLEILLDKGWNSLDIFHGNSTSSFTVALLEDYEGYLPRLTDTFEFVFRNRVLDGKDECVKSLTCVRLK